MACYGHATMTCCGMPFLLISHDHFRSRSVTLLAPMGTVRNDGMEPLSAQFRVACRGNPRSRGHAACGLCRTAQPVSHLPRACALQHPVRYRTPKAPAEGPF